MLVCYILMFDFYCCCSYYGQNGDEEVSVNVLEGCYVFFIVSDFFELVYDIQIVNGDLCEEYKDVEYFE